LYKEYTNKRLVLKNNNFKSISIGVFLSFSIKYFTKPYIPNKSTYSIDIAFEGTNIKVNIDVAVYTIREFLMLVVIIERGITHDANPNKNNLFIDIKVLKYKNIKLIAVKIPPKAKCLLFI